MDFGIHGGWRGSGSLNQYLKDIEEGLYECVNVYGGDGTDDNNISYCGS